MLRSEFRFSIERQPQRLLAWLLGEPVLGFLAIISVALTLFPMLFVVSPSASNAIDLLQWGIIGWFAFEYVLAFASAANHLAFLRNPWRLLDLATVLLPLATLLPTVSNALRSSPVLRLIRLGRLVTLGVRVSGITIRHRSRHEEEQTAVGAIEITLTPAVGGAAAPASREQLRQWLAAPSDDWFHVSSPGPGELGELSAAMSVPTGFLETHLFGTNYAHAAVAGGTTALFVRVPEVDETGQVQRRGVLFVPRDGGLLSLSRRSTPAIGRIARLIAPAAAEDRSTFGVRVITLALEELVRENENLAGQFEQELHALEDLPVQESKPVFFERTFRLKKELSAAQADLWRVKGMLAELAERRLRLPGAMDTNLESFSRMRASVDYLYDTIVNVREEILSVIDLHLNVVSFEMNRVMRVLAVVSVLGLIPAVIGGLFGMNLADNPWPFTLPQVAFGVCFGMVLCLYLFFVKGWLR